MAKKIIRVKKKRRVVRVRKKEGIRETSIADLKALYNSPYISAQMKSAITKELERRGHKIIRVKKKRKPSRPEGYTGPW